MRMAFAAVCLYPASVLAFEVTLDAPAADKDLRERLAAASLVFAAKADGTDDGQDIVAAAQSDYKRMVGLLYEQGYFGPRVRIQVNGQEAADISPFANIPTVRNVVISVTPGTRFRFGRAQVKPLAPDTELPAEFATGEQAAVSTIQKTARAGVEGWRDQGYAKAEVSNQSITANHRTSQLDVDLALAPGPRLSFGNLVYKGKSRVREKRIREISGLPTGETFDPEKAKRVATRLRRTGTFKSVNLREADQVGADDTLDMTLALVDDLPRRIGFGGEVESTDGVSVSAFWLHRNITGAADRLRFDASIEQIAAQSGGTDWRIGGLYTRPATLGPDTDMTFGIEIKQEDEDLYFLRQAGSRIGLVRHFSDQLEMRIGLGFRISEVDDNYGHRDFAIYSVPLGVTWDQRDNALDPTRGYYVNAELAPYLGFSDAENGVYFKSDMRAYRGLGADNRVILAGRLQLGSVFGPSLSETPPDFLFYTGGGDTVRGQPYQSNFVTVGGVSSGGLSFIGLSGELRVKTTNTITAVAFYDAGFVGETSDFTGAGNWQAGAGLGLRYNTGFGPLRVDLAAPVSGGTGDGVQLYIGIGHAF